MAASKFVTIVEGEVPSFVPTTANGRPSHLYLEPGIVHIVVPDDSRDEGIGETLAARLVADGKVVVCDKDGVAITGKRGQLAVPDAPAETPPPIAETAAPATPPTA